MTRVGVALQECVQPEHDRTPRAYDEFARRSRLPDIAVLWCREWVVEQRLVENLRAMGMEVACYVETQRPVIDVDVLRRFAQTVGDGTPVRICQEADGHWGAPWQAPSPEHPDGWEPPTYSGYFTGCRAVLRSEADIRAWWCPTNPRRAFDGGWWPGEADMVGFDRYVWESAEWPSQRFPGPIRQLEAIAPGVERWVGETGSPAGTTRRAEKLRQLGTIEGVDVVVVMNLLAERPDGKVDDWTWSPSMERAFAGMVA